MTDPTHDTVSWTSKLASDERYAESLKAIDGSAAIAAPFDFVFLDHDKDAYLSDLKYLMRENLVAKGSVGGRNCTG